MILTNNDEKSYHFLRDLTGLEWEMGHFGTNPFEVQVEDLHFRIASYMAKDGWHTFLGIRKDYHKGEMLTWLRAGFASSEDVKVFWQKVLIFLNEA